MPAFVQAFLDDFWIVVASGSDSDLDDAYKLVMWGFKFLGWALSMSKFELEGKRKGNGVILGHGLDLTTATRGVTDDKKARVRQAGIPMLTATLWSRLGVQKLLGLLQAIKDDVVRRWRLGPMYNVVYVYGHNASQFAGRGDMVPPGARARECLRKVLETLDERRSMFHRPTRWCVPSDPLMEMVPNGDACTTVGYGAVMIRDNVMEYFQGVWTQLVANHQPHISVLEAWTSVMIAFTWGPLFEGRKVIVRSDSKHACSSLNRLWARGDDMALLCDLWEDIQFYFGFEGLVVFCKGESNKWADAASRIAAETVEDTFSAQCEDLGRLTPSYAKIPVVWKRGPLSCDVGAKLSKINGG